MVRHSYSVLLPCLNTKVIKTQSIKTIESMLREGLGTIEEGVEYTPTPTPTPTPVPAAVARPFPPVLARTVSMQKRKVSAKLAKSPKGVWQLKISRFSTVISAPLSSLSHSYVRMMNGLADKGNLGGLGMYDSASAEFVCHEEKVDSLPRSLTVKDGEVSFDEYSPNQSLSGAQNDQLSH